MVLDKGLAPWGQPCKIHLTLGYKAKLAQGQVTRAFSGTTCISRS